MNNGLRGDHPPPLFLESAKRDATQGRLVFELKTENFRVCIYRLFMLKTVGDAPIQHLNIQIRFRRVQRRVNVCLLRMAGAILFYFPLHADRVAVVLSVAAIESGRTTIAFVNCMCRI